ncbi:MAG: DUF374 domain-containing protein [Myxococcales bacterium]|nr:MAG: DUF374 domain-containing protein [Myxococcales bacterium]
MRRCDRRRAVAGRARGLIADAPYYGRGLSRRRSLKRAGVRLLAYILPTLYLLYMRIVAATGRVDTAGAQPLFAASEQGKRVVIALLHQDLFCCPYLFRDRGIVTVASAGDAGDLISAILERCGFDVLRGGTSSRASRRSPIFEELRARIAARPDAITAVTPDGSRGPAGAVQPGIAMLACRTGAELQFLKIHARPALYLPTWDRTMIPLPFARIGLHFGKTLDAPERPRRAELEACRLEIERRLHELHVAAFASVGRAPVPALIGLRARRPARDLDTTPPPGA